MHLFFHPGAPKSATTFLQERLLSVTPGIRCVGRPNHSADAYVKFRHELVYGESKDDLVARFETLVDAVGPESIPMLSDETLFHVPSHRALAERLQQCCADVDVIITTRDQRTALPSLYHGGGYQLKGVPEPYNGRHVTFDNWIHLIIAQGVPDFDYWKAYRGYASVFGADRVHVVPMELLKRGMDLYRDRLSKILGVALQVKDSSCVNVAHSNRELWYYQMRDRVLRGRSLTRYIPGGAFLRAQWNKWLRADKSPELISGDEVIDWIIASYGQSNRQLATATGDSDIASYPGVVA